MIRAVEKVRERMLRAARALEGAKVAYAVAGGNAVAAWVSRVDEAAVRNTRDVDILLRRGDLPTARAALEAAGFVHRRISMIGQPGALDLFLDGPNASARTPSLAALVRMKLAAFRDKDRTHLRDLIEVGLLDETWLPDLPDELGQRLRTILATPEG